jgi:hypothetical protein
VVRTELPENHFQSSKINPRRGTTFLSDASVQINKINDLTYAALLKVLKMGQTQV